MPGAELMEPLVEVAAMTFPQALAPSRAADERQRRIAAEMLARMALTKSP